MREAFNPLVLNGAFNGGLADAMRGLGESWSRNQAAKATADQDQRRRKENTDMVLANAGVGSMDELRDQQATRRTQEDRQRTQEDHQRTRQGALTDEQIQAAKIGNIIASNKGFRTGLEQIMEGLGRNKSGAAAPDPTQWRMFKTKDEMGNETPMLYNARTGEVRGMDGRPADADGAVPATADAGPIPQVAPQFPTTDGSGYFERLRAGISNLFAGEDPRQSGASLPAGNQTPPGAAGGSREWLPENRNDGPISAPAMPQAVQNSQTGGPFAAKAQESLANNQQRAAAANITPDQRAKFLATQADLHQRWVSAAQAGDSAMADKINKAILTHEQLLNQKAP